MTGRVDATITSGTWPVRDQPWITGAAMAPIARTFDIDELVGDAEANGIAAASSCRPSPRREETDELLDLAGAYAVRARSRRLRRPVRP